MPEQVLQSSLTNPVSMPRGAPPDHARLKALSVEFEAAFLAQMLTAAGLGQGAGGFDGGVGESHMASFLVQAKAQVIAQHGGIGLAETVFRHLVEEAHGLVLAK